jgi:sugar phosphate isomerase/epimerase
MAFRLGAATYNYLWECSLDDALQNIAQTGIRFLEVMTTPPHMWIGDMDSAQCAHVRRLFEERNLTLAALNPTFLDISIASTNPGIRRESVRQIRETVRVCHELGAPIVVLSAGKRHPLIAPPFEHSLALILDSLAEIGEGSIDFGKVARILRGMDYQGLSILEIVETGKSDESILRSIRALANYGWAV